MYHKERLLSLTERRSESPLCSLSYKSLRAYKSDKHFSKSSSSIGQFLKAGYQI